MTCNIAETLKTLREMYPPRPEETWFRYICRAAHDGLLTDIERQDVQRVLMRTAELMKRVDDPAALWAQIHN